MLSGPIQFMMHFFYSQVSRLSSIIEHSRSTPRRNPGRGVRIGPVKRVWIALALIACSFQCLPSKKEPPGRFVPRGIPVNREFAEALVNFYAPINEKDQARLDRAVAATCDLRKAARGMHYNAVQLYQGEYSPGETRGIFCIWNPREELIEFGQYDDQGRLDGVHATFYREKLRSVKAWAGSARKVRIARGWDWVLNDQKWNVTLAYIKLENIRPGRTVDYIFERQTGYLVKRREYIESKGGNKIHLGIHYNGYPSKEYPQCVEYLAGGRTRIIADQCSFRDEIIPGSNRF